MALKTGGKMSLLKVDNNLGYIPNYFPINNPMLSNSYYNIYVHLVDTFTENGKMFHLVKLGAANGSFLGRYGNSKSYSDKRHCFGLWHVDCSTNYKVHIDEPIHKGLKLKSNFRNYKWAGQKGNKYFPDSDEIYVVPADKESVGTFLKDISDIVKSDRTMVYRKDVYQDIVYSATKLVKDSKRYRLLKYCTRYGKTNVFLFKTRLENDKNQGNVALLEVVYCQNPKKSYESHINEYRGFECYDFIDLSENGFSDKLRETISNKRTPCLHLSLCQNNTKITEIISKLSEFDLVYDIVIDEADFGAHTSLQISKIKGICKNLKFISFSLASATGMQNMKKLFLELGVAEELISYYEVTRYELKELRDERIVDRVYFAINPDLKSDLIKSGWENFCFKRPQDMTEIEEKHGSWRLTDNCRMYWTQTIIPLTCPSESVKTPNDVRLKTALSGIHDYNADTVVFVPLNNQLESLIADELNKDVYFRKYCIAVAVNSDSDDFYCKLTNSNVQDNINNLADEAHKEGKQLVLIMGSMGNRSSSFKTVKNVILARDLEHPDQAAGRGDTWWSDDHDKSYIVDLCDNINNILSDDVLNFKRRVNNETGIVNIKDILTSVFRPTILTYSQFLQNPIVEVDVDTIISDLMRQSNFVSNLASICIDDTVLKDLSEPKVCRASFEEIGNLYQAFHITSGDSNQTKDTYVIKRVNKAYNQNKGKKESYQKDDTSILSDDEIARVEKQKQDVLHKRIHFNWLFNNVNLINTGKYDKDCLLRSLNDLAQSDFKDEFESHYGLDLNVLIECANLFKKHGINIDNVCWK